MLLCACVGTLKAQGVRGRSYLFDLVWMTFEADLAALFMSPKGQIISDVVVAQGPRANPPSRNMGAQWSPKTFLMILMCRMRGGQGLQLTEDSYEKLVAASQSMSMKCSL